jgi:hypothetical protein
LDLPYEKVKNILIDRKIIYIEHKIQHLTKFGEQFAKVFWITPWAPYDMTRESRIRYNPDLLKYLEVECGWKVKTTKVKEDGPQ